MQSTPQETKLIERTRKQERRWPRTRWVPLGMSALILAADGFLAYMMFQILASKIFSLPDAPLRFAIFWPTVALMAAAAGVIISFVMRDWHGNVHRMLLLRLLDVQLKQSSKDEKVG